MLVLLSWHDCGVCRQDRGWSARLLRAAGRAGRGRLLQRPWRGSGGVAGRRRPCSGPVGPGGRQAAQLAERRAPALPGHNESADLPLRQYCCSSRAGVRSCERARLLRAMSHPPCAESGDWSIRCTAAHRGHRRHSLPGTTEQPRAPGDIVRVDDGLPYFDEVIEGDGVSQGLRHRRGTGTGSISSELGTPARSRPATHLPWIHGAIGRADQQSPRQPRASERDHERPGSHGHPAADAQGDRAPRRRDRQDRRRRRDVPSGTRGAVGRCAGRSEGWKTLERGSLNPPTATPSQVRMGPDVGQGDPSA
jgi:hypothetical protein